MSIEFLTICGYGGWMELTLLRVSMANKNGALLRVFLDPKAKDFYINILFFIKKWVWMTSDDLFGPYDEGFEE